MAYGEQRETGVREARAFSPILRRSRKDPLARAPSVIRRRVGLCPELDCVRKSLRPGTLAGAERRAAGLGVGADRVLIASGAIGEETYLRALAASLDVPFETCEGIARVACPLSDDRLIEAGAAGLLPVEIAGVVQLVVAPRGLAARRLIGLLSERRSLRARIRITTADHLQRFVRRHAAGSLGRRAADRLRGDQPEFSAATPLFGGRASLLAGLAAIAAATALAPGPALAAASAALAAMFLGWTGLRLLGAASPPLERRPSARVAEAELPVYSVVVALYDEARAVPALVASLMRLDYPREKLDIKLVAEPDDPATKAAIARLGLGAPFEVIVAPAYGPKTKPKALNAALPFVRGSYLVVYDAEDRPEPGQLREALAAFRRAEDDLACVQAALTIDNTADGWLTRVFTAEYAGLFDVFLPGLARRRFPLPLGGSSNHFRTGVLRRVGGWDPHNVTEDADLGMRLARRGYRASMIASTTYEEAPARLVPWLRQRTRWFKGWMQTWLVHMRHPLRLARDLGPSEFAVFQLVVGGSVLSALAHPIFLAAAAYALLTDVLFAPGTSLGGAMMTGLHAGAVVAGYLTSAVLALLGLDRRDLLRESWAILFMPAHWLLLSLAAWRALYQLLRAPHHWEKTPHGLAKTSRLGRGPRRA